METDKTSVKSAHAGMAKFWLKVFRRVPGLAWASFLHLEAYAGVAAMAILLLDANAGENVTHWIGQHQTWAWAVLIAIFCHLLMKAVYERFSEVESESNRLRNGIQEEIQRSDQWREEFKLKYAPEMGKQVLDGIGKCMKDGRQIMERKIKFPQDQETGLVQIMTGEWIKNTKSFLEKNIECFEAEAFMNIPEVPVDPRWMKSETGYRISVAILRFHLGKLEEISKRYMEQLSARGLSR